MRILAQLWSLVLCGILLVILWGAAVTFPKFKRVIPDHGYRDVIGIPEDETSPVDGTIGIPRLQRGDLIAYRTSSETGSKLAFGYVLGLPGEVISHTAKRSEEEPATMSANDREAQGGTMPGYPADVAMLPVPLNHVYVLSDRHLMDSIAYGPIPGEFIIGRMKD